MRDVQISVVILAWTACLSPAFAAEEVFRDIEYARVGGVSLKTDLYRPEGRGGGPLVIWVHGGAWRSGSKNDVPIRALVDHGFAVASVDYRLSPVGPFPAQIHDIKAAIRFEREEFPTLSTKKQFIAIAGSSAGGHLAALVGVTNGVKELEGEVGAYRHQSSSVDAIVVFYGASNLTTILSQSTPHGLKVRVPALELLMKGQLDETQAKAIIDGFGRGTAPPEYPAAALASPVFHVDSSDPPLLWFHGDQDSQMPINQAHEMIGAYKKQGLPAQLEVVYGGAHGGKQFFTPAQIAQTADFLKAAMQPPTK
jgi:acetyl esterase/lipase